MSNWFKTSPTNFQSMKLNSIVFMQNSTQITLDLEDDITAKESALISVMFSVVVGSAMTFALWDYIGYIKEHGLERHFEFKEKQ